MPSLGRQFNSKKETVPAFSFGTASRETQTQKVFLSGRHEALKASMNSPGPVYSVPSCIGAGSKYGFGTDEQRKHPKAKYPDSSVDLTCALVDNQRVKFHSTKSVHFGTEGRMTSKNGEIIRVHPGMVHGTESPGALEYSPKPEKVLEKPPEYSFGPAAEPQSTGKVPPRIPLPLTGTPRTLGPGSHALPSSLGSQPHSARTSAPSWGFGTRRSEPLKESRQVLDSSLDLSSLGRQVVSGARSAPNHGFGSSTRDQKARTTLIRMPEDMGPAARMPKLNFHLDLPRPEKLIPKPGM